MKISQKTRRTLTAIVISVSLFSPTLAETGTPNGPEASVLCNRQGALDFTFSRPTNALQEQIHAYPEADVQRYVITKGSSKGFVPIQVDYSNLESREAEFSETPSALAVNSGLASEILQLTNAAREQHGLAPVYSDSALAVAAQGHSTEMLTLNYFSHTSPTPGFESPTNRVKLAGAQPQRVSENLFQAEGYPAESLAQVVVDSWLSSPGHRANLLDPQVTHVGLGVVEKSGKVSVTQVFGGGLR